MLSIKSNAIFEPSGENVGASAFPFRSTRLIGAPPSAGAVHNCADGASPGRSARKANCLESGDHVAARSSSWPSTSTERLALFSSVTTVKRACEMYATCVPSGEITASWIEVAPGMESMTDAAREVAVWANAVGTAMSAVIRQKRLGRCRVMDVEYTARRLRGFWQAPNVGHGQRSTLPFALLRVAGRTKASVPTQEFQKPMML